VTARLGGGKHRLDMHGSFGLLVDEEDGNGDEDVVVVVVVVFWLEVLIDE